MRIVYLTHNLRQENGGGVFSRRLVEGIRDRFGHTLTVLTTQPGAMPYERPILYPKRLRLLFTLGTIRTILRQVDLIHALDLYPYGVVAAVAALGLRLPLVITAVGTGAVRHWDRWLQRVLMRWACRRADQLVAVSHFTARILEKHVPGLNPGVIGLGVDFKEFDQRRSFPLSESVQRLQPYVLGVGSLRWRKGYHRSIAAFAKVAAQLPHLNYVIIGKPYSPSYCDRLTKEIAALGLEDRIFIRTDVDARETLLDFYRGAELFCLCSQTKHQDLEGFGLVFLEAAAAGLPVVGTTGSGIEDAVRNGQNGILVPPEDTDRFAEAIVKILTSRALRQQMREESLALARRSSWDSVIERYGAIYQSFTRAS